MLTGSTAEANRLQGGQRALRADRIGIPGLLLSVLAATAPQRGTARMAWRLVTSGIAAAALLFIACFAVKDFAVLIGANPGHGLRWVLPGIIALAALVGLVYGLVMRAKNPAAHARIGRGDEALRPDAATEPASA